MKKLALFDFDGTITTKDTFVEFIKYYKGSLKFWLGFAILSPLIIGFKLKIIPNWKAKELVLIYFFRGTNIQKFKEVCSSFTKELLPHIIRPQALVEIKRHQQESTPIHIVSASPELWIQEWTEELNIHLIGTKLEVINDCLTGKISGKNCYGPEKANRIKKAIQIDDFDYIEAYGDSYGDTEMLNLAHKSHYKPFRIKI